MLRLHMRRLYSTPLIRIITASLFDDLRHSHVMTTGLDIALRIIIDKNLALTTG